MDSGEIMAEKYVFCICLQKESSCSMLVVLWECPTQPLPPLTHDISGDLWNSVSVLLTQWMYFGRWIEKGTTRILALNSTFVLGSDPIDLLTNECHFPKCSFYSKEMESSLGILIPTIVLIAIIFLAQVRFAAHPYRIDPIKLLIRDNIWQTPST